MDLEKSFFMGDAAGREGFLQVNPDHSDSDVKFAANVGLPFKTPEVGS